MKVDIIKLRLANQQITGTTFITPGELVSWMVVMQAQEYALAKWAIGLRLRKLNDAQIEKAFNDGEILRTHVMRPTWHFIAGADIRWMLTLTAPRIHQIAAYYYRQNELDAKTLNRCNDIIARSLQGGKHLTRTQLQEDLNRAKITASGERLGHIVGHAELDCIICSGPRIGKQFTYALLDERAPQAKDKEREEALAELTRRYFASRGPATLQDFVYWSGLTMKDAKEGASVLPKDFVTEIIEGKEYIYNPSSTVHSLNAYATFLMPDYDEYGMSYKDRSILKGAQSMLPESSDGTRSHALVIDGKIAGKWKRIIKGNTTLVKTKLPASVSKTKKQAAEKAVKRYNAFTA